ncbi:hypothetical protein [Acinetobacter entericus]|uniref:Uncharacterized protein n=1 Tax=Acinetobacter entericus TaxID=2989714 RepID=A0ABT3NEJ4_9GAMM|nr:hypothetical protein [Acinetobacter entericus]MCW8037937.1 hypothetical protein [Acinetobacter entericus]
MKDICKKLGDQIEENEREKASLDNIQSDLKDEYALKKSRYTFKMFGNLTHKELENVISDYDQKIIESEKKIEELKKKFNESSCPCKV